jgi:hypothetical protein
MLTSGHEMELLVITLRVNSTGDVCVKKMQTHSETLRRVRKGVSKCEDTPLSDVCCDLHIDRYKLRNRLDLRSSGILLSVEW